MHRYLCGDEIRGAADAISAGEVNVVSQQERATFEALAVDLRAGTPDFVDLRDRAGWTVPPARTLDVDRHGTCLVIGASAAVLPVAERLSAMLAVTVLLTDAAPRPTAAPST